MRIEVPMLTPPELNPNARVHWAERHRAAKAFRQVAWAMAYNDNPSHNVIFDKAAISVRFIVPNHRVAPDPDNAVAMLKPALDGLVDAKILAGDTKEHVRYILPFFYEVDRERAPLTIFEIVEDT